MIIEDTLRDDRFADNPIVCGGIKIRFYAGIPIGIEMGFQTFYVGTLCVISAEPKKLTDAQKIALHHLGTVLRGALLYRRKELDEEGKVTEIKELDTEDAVRVTNMGISECSRVFQKNNKKRKTKRSESPSSRNLCGGEPDWGLAPPSSTFARCFSFGNIGNGKWEGKGEELKRNSRNRRRSRSPKDTGLMRSVSAGNLFSRLLHLE
jgi:hypothetical protein